ncbi:MAG: type II and III secretion system family protein [Mariprofundus sp.]|nr:type II and III secretion system family protein [Mariprofundus sp.]
MIILRSLSLVLMLFTAATAFAASDVVSIDYLPLQEAAAIARSQLSTHGKVAVVASRRILIISDDASHLKKAKKLLKKMDVVAQQYSLKLTMQDISSRVEKQTQARVNVSPAALPGGWFKLKIKNKHSHHGNSRQFTLRLSAGQAASMEVGTLAPTGVVRQWLSGYGVVERRSVELESISSGFVVMARPAGADHVHLRITPWMQHADGEVQGRQEMLLGLGTTQSPATPPTAVGNLRFNGTPTMKPARRIQISGAATELTLKRGEEVEIAASSGEASHLGQALLSRYSTIGKRQFVMRLKID